MMLTIILIQKITIVINIDDARIIVRGIEQNKKNIIRYPNAQLILDLGESHRGLN